MLAYVGRCGKFLSSQFLLKMKVSRFDSVCWALVLVDVQRSFTQNTNSTDLRDLSETLPIPPTDTDRYPTCRFCPGRQPPTCKLTDSLLGIYLLIGYGKLDANQGSYGKISFPVAGHQFIIKNPTTPMIHV